MPCDANTLIAQAAANGYYGLDERDLKIAILQLLCSSSGGGGGITLAQALAYVEANATAFDQASVSFVAISAAGGAFLVNSSGEIVGLNLSIGAIELLNNGSATFAGGALAVGADGRIANGTAFALEADGSGNVSNGVVIFSAGGDVEITDTTKGVILKSPDGTRYRIKVADDGTLGTEPA